MSGVGRTNAAACDLCKGDQIFLPLVS
eukprot:SAG11_NODE_33869_length_275_cov_0.573864_1_plen_26_part_01